jgi:toxin FitB
VIVVDSSGWIDFFTDGQLAARYAARLCNPTLVVLPVIVLYEVYRRLKRDLS